MQPTPSLLLVVTRSDQGGAQRAVLVLARAAAAHGWGVTVAAGAEGGAALAEACAAAGVAFRRLAHLRREIAPLEDAHAAGELRALVRVLRPTVLHAHSSKAGAVAALALLGLRERPRHVYTAHGWVFLEGLSAARRAAYRWIERMAAVGRDATIVLSPQEKDAARAAHVARADRLHVIPNGVAPAVQDRAAARATLASLGVPADATVVGCVANVFPNKNLPALLSAFAASTPPDAHLVLIGSGTETLTGDRVHGLGERDARPLLAGLDLFVLPSKKEGLPFSLLEAMEASLPCLATAVGGIPSVIADGMNGWLVAPERLEDGLRRMFAARDQWPRIGKAATDTIHTLFSEERMVRETFALYVRLTAAP